MTRTYSMVERIDAFNEGGDTGASYAAEPGLGAKNIFSIRFGNSEVGQVDLSEPHAALWLAVLRSLHERQMPAYVEIDKRTKRITNLLQPKLQPVAEIQPMQEGPDLRIGFLNSHALHVLRRKHPRFKAFLDLLRQAQRNQTLVWVTDTLDTHEIIDVRPAEKPDLTQRKSSNP
jgi:hypothetical protein